MTALIVLFLLFDGITKVMKASFVLAACAQIGLSQNLVAPIGIILLACTVLYLIPQTSILGAILLTGYLGALSAFSCALEIRSSVKLCSRFISEFWRGSLCTFASLACVP